VCIREGRRGVGGVYNAGEGREVRREIGGNLAVY
jgi:hypothetical protein